MKKIFFLLLISTIFSCTTKKDILYFQDIEKNNKNEKITFNTSKIQFNDILYIKVTAFDNDATVPFNMPYQSSDTKLTGYLVDYDGNISFPVLGKIRVESKTISEAEAIIKDLLVKEKLLKDPQVSVRVVNKKITILGQVSSPGTYEYSEENITLLQALGKAGDLAIEGKRKNILIIREENGIRTNTTIDITKTDWFNSPYYYIKQNDVIYVTPNERKIKSAGFITGIKETLGIITGSLALILFLTK
jgi:polysaccharide export outer membrane protein